MRGGTVFGLVSGHTIPEGEEAVMIGTLDQARCRNIATHVATEYARDRVARALYEAIVDGLEFGPRDLPKAEDREWLRRAMTAPLHEATEAALAALGSSVGQALERAPTGFLDRFEGSHHLQDLGYE
jgi:hypothetical protein